MYKIHCKQFAHDICNLGTVFAVDVIQSSSCYEEFDPVLYSWPVMSLCFRRRKERRAPERRGKERGKELDAWTVTTRKTAWKMSCFLKWSGWGRVPCRSVSILPDFTLPSVTLWHSHLKFPHVGLWLLEGFECWQENMQTDVPLCSRADFDLCEISALLFCSRSLMTGLSPINMTETSHF